MKLRGNFLLAFFLPYCRYVYGIDREGTTVKFQQWLLAFLGSLFLLTPAYANLIVDDFNTATLYSADQDDGAVNAPVDGTNLVMVPDTTTGPAIATGWTRTISATRTVGTDVDVKAEICNFCLAAHLVSDALSAGTGTWNYSGGGALDLSAYTGVSFLYSADLDGAVVRFAFSNGDTVNSSALANTGTLDLISLSLGSGDYSSISSIAITVDGAQIQGLDFTLDEVMLVNGQVPAPATLALMGLGLAGISYRRKRVKAA